MRSTNTGVCGVDGTKKIIWSSRPFPYFSSTVVENDQVKN